MRGSRGERRHGVGRWIARMLRGVLRRVRRGAHAARSDSLIVLTDPTPADHDAARLLVEQSLPPTPRPLPPIPMGWDAAEPTWIGIGSQKAGTTWWSSLLERHPDVRHVPGRAKEVHFFDEHWRRPLRPNDREEYYRYFSRPPGTAAGEWTPNYLHNFWMPPVLSRVAPNARLLVLVRDPLDRFLSGVLQMQRLGVFPTWIVVNDALERSRYAAQLDRLFDHVPRERVLVQQYKRCRLDPVGELRRTFEFVGLEPVVPDRISANPNPTREPKPDLPPEVEEQVVELLRPDVERLEELCPEIDLELWPAFT